MGIKIPASLFFQPEAPGYEMFLVLCLDEEIFFVYLYYHFSYFSIRHSCSTYGSTDKPYILFLGYFPVFRGESVLLHLDHFYTQLVPVHKVAAHVPQIFPDGLAALLCADQMPMELLHFFFCNGSIHVAFLLFSPFSSIFKHTKKDHFTRDM